MICDIIMYFADYVKKKEYCFVLLSITKCAVHSSAPSPFFYIYIYSGLTSEFYLWNKRTEDVILHITDTTAIIDHWSLKSCANYFTNVLPR